MLWHRDPEELRPVLEGALGPLAAVNLLSVDCGVTDNLTSGLARVRARVRTAAGRKEELCILVKSQDANGRCQGVSTELKVYRNVLPKMEKLMVKLGHQEILWAHCLGHVESILVLEDLQELGYHTADRAGGLDYPHAALAVRALAQFHALSVGLQDSGDLKTTDFSGFVFDGGYDHINGSIRSSFQYLQMVAAKEWSDEWKDIIENVGHIPSIAVDKLREITTLQPRGFHVLNHGDAWVNNMMFKYSQGAPESVRFVDYQLSHYNSYAFDLHYLFNTSLSTEVLHHLDRLYEEYHYHLTAELTRLGRADGPSLAEVYSELERTEFFGLFSAVAVAPVVMDKEDSPLPDDGGPDTLHELERRKEERYRTEEYTRRIQVILRRAQHGGLFKRIFM